MSKSLIVAYQTAGGRALRERIAHLAGADLGAEFVLLVPVTRTQHLFTWTDGESRAVAQARAEEAAQLLRAAGIRLTAVHLGDPDPFVAVSDELGRQSGYDSIIVSTFPPGVSRWLRLDLPARLERQFHLPVIHVVVEPPAAHG